ncbi:MAG TPA: trypsin-like peptidase domain-containing protein [Ignavibacteria bacterium]|nr:trypsin-like peptidase domain-containing protein [Ignavibacteria bacterium]HQY51434.1 trypsin-like peptidase domain-containing protein [Ignavibacteria bacterium]HRA99236.1 trypsin-like peptidase domain-containing protein [Ignavibacteria bacterium]
MILNIIKENKFFDLRYFLNLLKLLTSVFIIFISCENVSAQDKTVSPDNYLSDDDFNAEQIIDNNKESLISIWKSQTDYYSYGEDKYIDTSLLNGSGFILNEEGLIGTNNHVIEGIDSLIIKTSNGNFFYAEVVMSDAEKDFALIRIVNSNGITFKPVKLGNSDDLKAGQEVFAIGSPLGFEYTISSGIVAAVRENEKVNFGDPYSYTGNEKLFEKVIQITAAISPGNSGGALFNRKGEVIGITTYTYLGYGNLNFAIAINSFKKFMDFALLNESEITDDMLIKKEENIFNTTFKNAVNQKWELAADWYYTKLKDSLDSKDEFTLRQDSINKVRFVKVEELFNNCLTLQPDSFFVYEELLDLYVNTDNPEKTEVLYETILKRFDSDSLLNLISSKLAAAYSSTGNYEKALKFYYKMLDEDSRLYYVNFQIAAIYEEKKDYKNAVAEYKNLLVKDPTYIQAYTRLGKIYYEQIKDINKAKYYLEKGYNKELEQTGYTTYDTDMLYYLGMIAVKEEKKLEAILYFMDLKSNAGYYEDAVKKKTKLLKEIKKLDE